MNRKSMLQWGAALLALNLAASAFCDESRRVVPLDNASAGTGVGGIRPLTTSDAPQVMCQKCLEAAVASFKSNDYDIALKHVTDGLAQSPDEAEMLQFRALVLFARRDYQEASASLHRVLAVRPAWNWAKLSRFYPSVETYTTQLRTLEAYTRRNPGDGAARFLQAYHYMVAGFPDAATRELEMVVRLESNDSVAAVILRASRRSSTIDATRY